MICRNVPAGRALVRRSGRSLEDGCDLTRTCFQHVLTESPAEKTCHARLGFGGHPGREPGAEEDRIILPPKARGYFLSAAGSSNSFA